MKDFTVEVVTKPVVNDDWSTLRSITDIIPGTLLIEDPQEPTLVIPVEAETLQSAAVFVQGVMTVVKLDIVWGRAYRTEPCDFDTYHDSRQALVPDFAPAWLEGGQETDEKRELLDA